MKPGQTSLSCGFPCHLTPLPPLPPLPRFSESTRRTFASHVVRTAAAAGAVPQHDFSERLSIALKSEEKCSNGVLAELLSGCQTVAGSGDGPATAAKP